MRLVTAPRGAGKTVYLVRALQANPRRMLCVHSAAARTFITSRWPDVADRVFTYAEWQGGFRTLGLPEDTEIMIDEVQMLIQQLFGSYAIGDITGTFPITQLNTQVIQRRHTTESGQKYMAPSSNRNDD